MRAVKALTQLLSTYKLPFMQDINSLPLNFFEDISIHPLDHRSGRYNITTDKYFVFGHQDQFRGIKRSFNDDLFPSNSSLPFYLLHKETFEVTKKIFNRMFHHEPDLVTVFHDENKTWNAFLIGSTELTKYEYKSDSFFNETLFGQLDYFKSTQFDHFPLIGGINNYEQDKNPAFFYLIAAPFKDVKGSVLTMDNFRFLKDSEKAILMNGPREEALEKIANIIEDRFQYSGYKFDMLLQDIASHYVSKNEFTSILLDLYNQNRNPESVRNDPRLQNTIKKLYREAQEFVRKKPKIPWSEFIHFITRNNQFDVNSIIQLDVVEELFSKKLAYQKFERVFTPFVRGGQGKKEYISSQVDAWLRIEDQILNSRS